MRAKPKKKLSITLILIILCLCSPLLYYVGRPLPIEMRRELYDGVVYYRRVHFMPYPMIAHIVTIDLEKDNISFLVTPGDDNELPLKARTTSKFLREFDAQIAINGDGFTPWVSNGPFDYYPHSGERVVPNGYAASAGNEYSGNSGGPTLFISKNNVVSFRGPTGPLFNAISGDRVIVKSGKPVARLDNEIAAPRTAVGIDSGGKKMIIVVADGRQPFYSSGATLAELADLLVYYGAEYAINMDGGGSSTLVFENWFGGSDVINSPIHTFIPGRERPVGNHLGIFVK
jgi:hypothetical protein